MPAQNASIAVPFSSPVMTGRAMLRDVASSAAASVMMQIDVKARMRSLLGLKGTSCPVAVGGIVAAVLSDSKALMTPGESETSSFSVIFIFIVISASG